jgi:hypothetical protein
MKTPRAGRGFVTAYVPSSHFLRHLHDHESSGTASRTGCFVIMKYPSLRLVAALLIRETIHEMPSRPGEGCQESAC